MHEAASRHPWRASGISVPVGRMLQEAGAAAHQVVGVPRVERLRDGIDPMQHQGAAAGAALLVEHVPGQDGRVLPVQPPVDCTTRLGSWSGLIYSWG